MLYQILAAVLYGKMLLQKFRSLSKKGKKIAPVFANRYEEQYHS